MNVEVVQKKLWEQSQQHREHRLSDTPLFPVNQYDGRVRKLMDLMHQPQWIAAACDRVLQRSRGKAAGVDRVLASEFQQNRRANLEELRLELKRGTYQPQPLRRVMIPKANGKYRGLGIPCLRDKIVQEAFAWPWNRFLKWNSTTVHTGFGNQSYYITPSFVAKQMLQKPSPGSSKAMSKRA